MKPTQMLKPLPALAVALFLAAGEVPEAQAQGAPECGCLAMRNVKNRLCRPSRPARIQSFNGEIRFCREG